MTEKQLEQELIMLPPYERLRLARWLLDSVIEEPQTQQEVVEDNPLLHIAGRFFGGPGNSAEQAEEILAKEVNAKHGLGTR